VKHVSIHRFYFKDFDEAIAFCNDIKGYVYREDDDDDWICEKVVVHNDNR